MIRPIYLLTSALSGDSTEFVVLATTKRHLKLKGRKSVKWVTRHEWEECKPVLIGKAFLWFKLYYQEEKENA
jgi:hypothetical protein